MPLYQFVCSECEHPFETLVPRVSAELKDPCPECGSQKVERTFALPAKPKSEDRPATICQGDGPPCGAQWCRRK